MRYLGSSRKTGFDEQKPEVSLRYYTDMPDRQLIQILCYFLNFVMFVTIAFSILNKTFIFMPKTKGIAYIMMHLVQSTLGLFLTFILKTILHFGRVAKTAEIVFPNTSSSPALPKLRM